LAYGRISALENLDQRRKDISGSLEHLAAIAEPIEIVDEEVHEDPAMVNSD